MQKKNAWKGNGGGMLWSKAVTLEKEKRWRRDTGEWKKTEKKWRNYDKEDI